MEVSENSRGLSGNSTIFFLHYITYTVYKQHIQQCIDIRMYISSGIIVSNGHGYYEIFLFIRTGIIRL